MPLPSVLCFDKASVKYVIIMNVKFLDTFHCHYRSVTVDCTCVFCHTFIIKYEMSLKPNF